MSVGPLKDCRRECRSFARTAGVSVGPLEDCRRECRSFARNAGLSVGPLQGLLTRGSTAMQAFIHILKAVQLLLWSANYLIECCISACCQRNTIWSLHLVLRVWISIETLYFASWIQWSNTPAPGRCWKCNRDLAVVWVVMSPKEVFRNSISERLFVCSLMSMYQPIFMKLCMNDVVLTWSSCEILMRETRRCVCFFLPNSFSFCLFTATKFKSHTPWKYSSWISVIC